MTAILRRLGLLLGLLAIPSAAGAHRLDEYLQATLVIIEPTGVRLQINLTPGVAVADQVLTRIDRDHDGVISTNEAAAYAESVRRDLVVMLDRHKVALNLTASSFPTPSELRTGSAIIELEFSAGLDPLSPGAHKFSLKNRHLPSLSVYLFNAAQPRSTAIQITKQTRDKHQSTGEIDFVIAR